jgi:hypothetical protein
MTPGQLRYDSIGEYIDLHAMRMFNKEVDEAGFKILARAPVERGTLAADSAVAVVFDGLMVPIAVNPFFPGTRKIPHVALLFKDLFVAHEDQPHAIFRNNVFQDVEQSFPIVTLV